jgi:hypothetical protein
VLELLWYAILMLQTTVLNLYGCVFATFINKFDEIFIEMVMFISYFLCIMLKLSQQEYLVAKRPDFIQNAEYRRQCLHELAYLRELRQKSKLRLLALATHISRFDGDNTPSVNSGPLPPPPLGKEMLKHFFFVSGT